MHTIPAPLGVTTVPVMWDTHVDGRYAGTAVKVGGSYETHLCQRVQPATPPGFQHPSLPSLAEAEAHITREARREGVRR